MTAEARPSLVPVSVREARFFAGKDVGGPRFSPIYGDVGSVQAGPVMGAANGVQPAPESRKRAARAGWSGVGIVVTGDEAAEGPADRGLRDPADEGVGAEPLEGGEVLTASTAGRHGVCRLVHTAHRAPADLRGFLHSPPLRRSAIHA